MSNDSNTLSSWLWNEDVSVSNYGSKEQYYEHIFEQYKILVEAAERVSTRRNVANTFFLTLHTLIVGVVGVASESKVQFTNDWFLILPLVAVLALCYVWWRLLLSYRQLNSAKYKVIDEYEKRLPSSPYVSAEWRVLGEGKDSKLYQPMTNLEQGIPIVFGFLYLIGVFSVIIP